MTASLSSVLQVIKRECTWLLRQLVEANHVRGMDIWVDLNVFSVYFHCQLDPVSPWMVSSILILMIICPLITVLHSKRWLSCFSAFCWEMYFLVLFWDYGIYNYGLSFCAKLTVDWRFFEEVKQVYFTWFISNSHNQFWVLNTLNVRRYSD